MVKQNGYASYFANLAIIFYITPLSESNFSISCCNSFAFSAATCAKSIPFDACMIPREEFTSSPHSSVMPYFATSARLPPCAPTPGTSRKCSGRMRRTSSNILPCVAPTTYIILPLFPHADERRMTVSNRGVPAASVVSWKSCEPLLL